VIQRTSSSATAAAPRWGELWRWVAGVDLVERSATRRRGPSCWAASICWRGPAAAALPGAAELGDRGGADLVEVALARACGGSEAGRWRGEEVEFGERRWARARQRSGPAPLGPAS
jgi:hypothetical protein